MTHTVIIIDDASDEDDSQVVGSPSHKVHHPANVYDFTNLSLCHSKIEKKAREKYLLTVAMALDEPS
jgi:hypothetical protein